MVPNLLGATYSGTLGQYPETDLHLAVIEAACTYREEEGSLASSVALFDALADFMGKVNIFKPIIEVWKCTMFEDILPIGHEQAGKRGLHVPHNYVERKSGGWKEISTIVLSEDLHWGVVWSPKEPPRGLSVKDYKQQRPDHCLYEPKSASELVSLKIRAGGNTWGVANSLLREVLIARNRAESRMKHLFGMVQTLIMTEQIARVAY